MTEELLNPFGSIGTCAGCGDAETARSMRYCEGGHARGWDGTTRFPVSNEAWIAHVHVRCPRCGYEWLERIAATAEPTSAPTTITAATAEPIVVENPSPPKIPIYALFKMKCETCKGEGTIYGAHSGFGGVSMYACGFCHGNGWIMTPERRQSEQQKMADLLK